MIIKKLTLEGLRGFSEKREIEFAIPDKINNGSGLTVMVGPNNSGKSTVIEAVHILNSNNNAIPKNARNIINNKIVKIEVEDIIGNKVLVQTTKNGGSYIERKYNNEKTEVWPNNLNAFVLSNKRNFSSTFGNSGEQTRENYRGNSGNDSYRNENNINHNFGGRLIKIFNEGNSSFNECLSKVLTPVPKWTIESSNENQMYLEFSFGKTDHSSQGAGDGYINIFNIIDSLYDSAEDNIILIDEPEVSLHPDLQRKLFNLLLEYSKDKQIIISTHSPYFVDWKAFSSYSKIIRFRKEEEKISCYELSNTSKDNIKRLLKDTNNIHTLSLDTCEIFFLSDNIILTEGPDDVFGYKKLFKLKDYNPDASFFGWGLGGADNANIVLKILEDLGYKKVFTILDCDRKSSVEKLKKDFPQYSFYAITANDIRNKERPKKVNGFIEEIKKKNIEETIKNELIQSIEKNFPEKEGIFVKLNDDHINEKYEETIKILIEKMDDYFKNDNKSIKKDDLKNKITENEQEKAAQRLLDDYLRINPLHTKIEKKYKHIKFKGGSGGPISFKKISKNKYYAIIEDSQGVTEKYSITIQYHFIINIKSKKVTLKKEKIIKDTIPKKY